VTGTIDRTHHMRKRVNNTTDHTFEKALKRFFLSGYDPAQHKTAQDLAFSMLHELDLHEEGEDNELTTARLRTRAKAFITEFGDSYTKSEAAKKGKQA
jgi:hypothetical protein